MDLPDVSRQGVREAPLHVAIAAVNARKSFELLGARGSGRTTFLNRLSSELRAEGWRVHRIDGVASLRPHPLAAIQVAGMVTSPMQRNGSGALAAAAADLDELLDDRSVIMIDDWDDLDEVSWGVLTSVHVRGGTPLVLSRLSARPAGRPTAGVHGTGLTMPLAIELHPIDHDEVRHLVEGILGGRAAPDLVTDVFVQTGGHVGMAAALLDAARREGRVLRRGDVWTGTGLLYGSSCRWWFESLVSDLSDQGRDALEIIAVCRSVTLSGLVELFSWATIEDLDQRQHVRLVGSQDRTIVLHPPALREFLSETVTDTRRHRIAERVRDQPGIEYEAPVERAGDLVNRAPVLAGVMSARLHSARVGAHAVWRVTPSVEHAAVYLRSLMHGRAAPALFEEVVSGTRYEDGGGAQGLRYLSARADWHAFREGDLPRAIALLQAPAAADSATGALARAKILQLRVMLGVVPDDYESTLSTDPSYPDDVNGAVTACLALTHLVYGRIHLAEQALARIPHAGIAPIGIDVALLRGVIQLYSGEIKEGIRYAAQSYQAAADRFDAELLRAFSWLYTQNLTYTRDLGGIAGVLTLMAGVPETATRGPYQLGLLNNAIILSLTRNQPDLARADLSEMDAIRIPDGPLPGQQRDLARARLLMHEGKVDEGAQLLRALGDDLWGRGRRLAAVHAYLLAQEAAFDRDLYDADLARFGAVDGRLIGLHVDYFTAFATDDVSGLSEVAYEMVENGLLAWALHALERAAELVKVADEGSRRGQIEARIRSLRSRLPADVTLDGRRSMIRTPLSDREMEFVGHVATGATNKEIAERMRVSRRTVESAIARISRKLDVRGRGGIADWAAAQRRLRSAERSSVE